MIFSGLTWWLSGKEPTCQCRRHFPWVRKISWRGKGNDNPLQYSCLRNPIDRRAWEVTFHGVKKELDTTWWLKIFSNQDKLYFHALFFNIKIYAQIHGEQNVKKFSWFFLLSQAPSWLDLALTATTPTKRKYNFTLFNYSFISSVFFFFWNEIFLLTVYFSGICFGIVILGNLFPYDHWWLLHSEQPWWSYTGEKVVTR